MSNLSPDLAALKSASASSAPCSLAIFVHRASEFLTDYESHGEGVIAFSLLDGLARRGHRIWAYTNRVAIRQSHPNLQVRAVPQARVPANSLAAWEHSWRADRWFQALAKQTQIDLVWRMAPTGRACPYPPSAGGRPLVVGPLFEEWPSHARLKTGRRLGLDNLVGPLGDRGWRRTLSRANLLLGSLPDQTRRLGQEYPLAQTLQLPLIVEPPPALRNEPRIPPRPPGPLRLIFVANLQANKNPQIFGEIVELLQRQSVPVEGWLVGDGPERAGLEAFRAAHGLEEVLHFAGKVPNEEVYARLAQADLLISTSLGEPYGRSIVEGMAVGTPPVCHRSGGPAQFVEHGRDGLLVDDLTASAFVRAIADLYAHPARWQSLSEGARLKAATWTSEAIIGRLEERLLSLCPSK